MRRPGLVQPGSLVRWTYRLNLPPTRAPDAASKRSRRRPARALPEAGWEIRSRVNADPRFARNIERFTPVSDARRPDRAARRRGRRRECGARLRRPQARVDRDPEEPRRARAGRWSRSTSSQVMLIAALGIAIGLARRRRPALRRRRHCSAISCRSRSTPTLAFGELGVALLYGAAHGARLRARAARAARTTCRSPGLFRDQVDPERRWPRKRYLVALARLRRARSSDLRSSPPTTASIALMFVAASAGAFVLLRLVASGHHGRCPAPAAPAPGGAAPRARQPPPARAR